VQQVADLIELVDRRGLVVGVVEKPLQPRVSGRRRPPGDARGARVALDRAIGVVEVDQQVGDRVGGVE
jgi:hypothetical protein